MTEEKSRLSVISQNTLVPLTAVGALIGFTFWLSNIYQTGEQNKRDITEIKSAMEQFSSLSDRMTRMETKLDILIEQVK